MTNFETKCWSALFVLENAGKCYLLRFYKFLNYSLLDFPEFCYVAKALFLSEQGVQIVGQTLNDVSELMLQLPYMNGFDRMLHFFKMMDIIGQSDSLIHLTSKEYLITRFSS